MNSVKLRIFKDKFKFSAAHFLIFDEKRAERLHGHNYRVRLDISAPADQLDPHRGFLLDFGEVKDFLAEELEKWDERVLLPAKHPDMKFELKGESLQVWFRERFYVFPDSEVIRLPIVNTSVEALSQLIAERLNTHFKNLPLSKMTVEVEESPGQSASYTFVR